MINKILWTKNAIADFKISQRINPQVNEKTKEIIGYLTNNKPPYKAFHAERLGSNAKYANCWSMHLSHKHRIVFAYENDTITILLAYTHYGDH